MVLPTIDSVSVLEQILSEQPLTAEYVDRFVIENLVSVKFCNLPSAGSVSVFSERHTWYHETPWSWNSAIKFLILINPKYGFEESCVTFVHETIHALYAHYEIRAFRAGVKRDEIERLIEEEAKRFYERNKSFVEKIVRRY